MIAHLLLFDLVEEWRADKPFWIYLSSDCIIIAPSYDTHTSLLQLSVYLPHFSKKVSAMQYLTFLSAPVLLQSNLSVFSGMKTYGSHKSQKYNWDSVNILQSNGPLFWMAVGGTKHDHESIVVHRSSLFHACGRTKSNIEIERTQELYGSSTFYYTLNGKNKDFQCLTLPNPNDPSRVRIHTEATSILFYKIIQFTKCTEIHHHSRYVTGPISSLQVQICGSLIIVPVRGLFQCIYWSTIYRKHVKANVSVPRPKHTMCILKLTSLIKV